MQAENRNNHTLSTNDIHNKNNNTRRAALHNLGCKVNAYETDAMREQLENAGYIITPFEPGADVYIINTCTVTNIADRKSRQMLHKAKKMNPNAIVVATGCYVQAKYDEAIKDEAIDIVIGNNNKNKLVSIIDEYIKDNQEGLQNKENYIDVLKNCDYEELSVSDIIEHTRAFIKIQDGCNQFCTYCIIPYARGRIRSRNIDNIVDEITRLSKKGVKEVVLTGIHLSSYGKDLDENIDLLTVIKRVNDIEQIERIRLGSLEQGIITKDFVEGISSMKKVCPHFHLSLQSGCEATLKRMNRHYTPEEFLEKCTLIRKYYTNPSLTTDIIVGFPDEDEMEFEATKAFLEQVHFMEMHVFKYSMRQGTKASTMPNQVDDSIKTKRSNVLINMSDRFKKEFMNDMLDTSVNVLFEEIVELEGVNYIVGHTENYIKVAIKEDEGEAGKLLTNQIVSVNVKKILNSEILLAEI